MLLREPVRLLEQETLPLLLSTGWFQERIRAWFHNQTKINWGPYGRLKCQISPLIKYRQKKTYNVSRTSVIKVYTQMYQNANERMILFIYFSRDIFHEFFAICILGFIRLV